MDKSMQQPVPEQEEDLQLEEGEVQATPEEEQFLEAAFTEALTMIHGEGQHGDAIANLVLEAQDVAQGIGKATATVVIGVEKKMGQIPGDVKLQLAQEITAELTGLALEAGALAEDEVTDEWIDEVVSHAYSNYLTMKEAMGELDPAELEASVSEVEQATGTSIRQQAQPEQQPQPEKPKGLLGRV